MTARLRRLLDHPIVRTLLFERLLLTASALLAVLAIVLGRVRPAEIPTLLDGRLLALLFVLTVAVELGKGSDLFDRLVASVVRRARNARGLAFAMIGVTGLCAALLTNDVALLLVVPFTMLFGRVTEMNLAPLVALEVAAANLLGCLTPTGNPQNLFLFGRGGFTPGRFLLVQLPFVAGGAALLALAVPLLVPRTVFAPPATEPFDVDPWRAVGFLVLLASVAAALFGWIPWGAPLALAVGGVSLLGRRVREADFSLVFVFAFLFVGVAGLERGRLYRVFDPERFFGHGPTGLLVSGALISQVVSNVPAALLLAPAARLPGSLTGLLYGVNAGGCGTPIASLANLIGGELYRRGTGRSGPFWRAFLPVSFALLGAMLLWSLAVLRLLAR